MLFSAETWWKQSLVTSEKIEQPQPHHLLSNLHENILEYITVLWLGNNNSELKDIAIFLWFNTFYKYKCPPGGEF